MPSGVHDARMAPVAPIGRRDDGKGAVEIEAVLVAIDVGTSKVVALVGEVGRDGVLSTSSARGSCRPPA